jgi:hypothetical protein
VDNNSAGNGGFGGGISNAGTVTLLSSEVDHNNASGGGGGIGNFSKSGSAALVTLNSSQVHDNNATGSVGGGIWNFDNSSTLNLGSTKVYNNSAGDGGGIFNSGAVSLASSPVFGNNPNNCAPPGSVPGCSG